MAEADGGPGTPARARQDFLRNVFRNRALRTRAEATAAAELVEWLGLPSHHDPQKNWDTLKCLHFALSHKKPDMPVLDVGSSRSVINRWLSILGFRNLYACDLLAKDPSYFEPYGIRFSIQDLTRTSYESEFFSTITSISVIEHNVDLAAYLDEMARLLKRGGLLLTSTDYWSEPVDCSGIFPYGPDGGEMKVFEPDGIREYVRLAQERGFSLAAPLELDTEEKVIHWERVDRRYTFMFIALRRK
ncbi:methyltransferase domain-containing protein [Thalassobaculum sp.]|uniref:methyltransferase domain-containing protein n=1 Tax=Thalassobaculum sp. TaxID=2022740 RepID=UPI0032EF778C